MRRVKTNFRLIATLLITCLIIVNQNTNAQVKKMVLVEHFTNTYCGLCAFKNPVFVSDILDVYDDVDIFNIRYHPPVPYAQCPLYQANASPQEWRSQTHYSVTGTPRVAVDGTMTPVGTPILPVTTLQSYLGQTSPISVHVTEKTTGTDQRSVQVQVNTVGDAPTGNLKLRVVVLEKIVNFNAWNGETEHHNTFRMPLNNWETETFTPASKGNKTQFSYSYTIDPSWDASQTYVIAFIENDNTSEVLNAGSSWNLLDTNPARAKVKMVLQGGYDNTTNTMSTTLQTNSLVGATQNFNTAPWDYTGNEMTTSLPTNAVDWVLVEVRDIVDNNIVLERSAGILLNDGTVVSPDGSAGVEFTGIPANKNYYVVVRARNHVAVMSNNTVSLPNVTTYDFSTAMSQALGTDQLTEVTTGVFALKAGDINGDGVVNVDDETIMQSQAATLYQYSTADLNYDAHVTVHDYNIYVPNSSALGIDPIRY